MRAAGETDLDHLRHELGWSSRKLTANLVRLSDEDGVRMVGAGRRREGTPTGR
ncbi:MAG: hypothetical protein ACKVWR_11940 [Acidimicrobiales bacterium]